VGHLNVSDLAFVLARAKIAPQVYIETGCNRGDQLIVAAEVKQFRRVVGIELDGQYAAMATSRVARAEVKHGDTSVLLPELMESISEPVFIVLDAHYCALNPPIQKSPFPLWDELSIFRERAKRYADIVVVDDVHTFGKAREDLRFGKQPEWETVTAASISAYLGAPGYEIGDGYVVHLPGC